MLVCLALSAAASAAPISFPERPIDAQVVAGEHVLESRKSIDWVFGDDCHAFGLWFDGKQERYTDEAIWISPDVASRWLGYLRMKEGWGQDELQARWKQIRAALDGRITVAVRLDSFPRQDPLEFGNYEAGTEARAGDARFDVTFELAKPVEGAGEPLASEKGSALANTYSLECDTRRLELCESYDWRELISRQWYEASDLRAAFAGQFEGSGKWTGVALGDCYQAWYWVSVPASAGIRAAKAFTLMLFQKGRTVRVEFSLMEPKRGM